MDGCGCHLVLNMPRKHQADASGGVMQLLASHPDHHPLGTQEGRIHVT